MVPVWTTILDRFPLSDERRSVPGIHWKDWCWSWNSNTLATWCEELTHWKRPWRWEKLKAGGEGDNRGWDGWMASPTQWTWVWVNSGSWWWTGRPGVLQFMGSQRVRHNWATELKWWTQGSRFFASCYAISIPLLLAASTSESVSMKNYEGYCMGQAWSGSYQSHHPLPLVISNHMTPLG